MKSMKTLCLLISIAPTILSGQSTGVKADFNPKVEEAIKQLEIKLSRLFMSSNFSVYANYLADDYLLIDPSGNVISKEKILEAFKSSATAGDSLFPSDMKVRIYGDTAILTGHLTYKSHLKDMPLREAQFTKVFVKRKGKWYLVNNQGSPVRSR